jgi:hypothetical protein
MNSISINKLSLLMALAAIAISIISVTRPRIIQDMGGRVIAAAGSTWEDERNYPPLVFTSKATLDCSISSTDKGRQVMKTVSGTGFSFDAVMLPITDGKVKINGPGMKYKFTAFPATTVASQLSGIGNGAITEMKAEVEVDAKRFAQPAGPGTAIRFSARDISSDAAYVEFTGVFVRESDHKRFPFRVVFVSVPEGSGRVVPANKEPEAPLASKAVVLGSSAAPASVTTALYEAEDDVRKLP